MTGAAGDTGNVGATGMSGGTGATGMSGLELRYRRLLRVLPAAYRGRWEEEMVDTFLLTALPADGDAEHAEFVADFGRPGAAEVWSVLTLAVRLRLGAGEQAGRAATYGAALRLVGLLGLLLLVAPTGINVVTLVNYLRERGRIDAVVPDAWWWVGAVTGLVWIGAYLALLYGFRRTCGLLGVLALGMSTSSFDHLLRAGLTWTYLLSYAAFLLIPGLLPLLALVAFHPGSPPLRRGRWLVALPAALAGAAGLALISVRPPLDFFDLPGIHVGLLLPTVAGYLLVRRSARVGRCAHWPLGLAILTGAFLTLRAVTLSAYTYPGLDPLYRAGVVEAALLLVALAVLVPLARRDLAALTPTPGSPPTPSAR